MTITVEQEQEIRRLLAANASERDIQDSVGASRRQVRNIKNLMSKEEDHNPLASDLGRTMTRAAAIKAVAALSTRPEGVRHSEMWPTLRALFGMCKNDKTGVLKLSMTDDQLRYLKKQTSEAAKAQGKEALFIPEWLPRQAPVAANDMLVMLAGHLQDRAQEYASEFMSCFPDTSSKLVSNELVCLAFAKATPEPVETRCRRNAATAQALQRRLGHCAGYQVINEPSLFVPEFDQLCI
ncbi:hypothetical protein DYL61_08745 [Pseudomonas nabeulensis]|uniref:Uncharacterized protein n=1 Tax=Pseudomonas nabeulensis TaxID=2293833 RepID=A0A4Z0B808_9PSED|nr:hypothetical protein [Pseudomonas nabeulensis]TFY94549.1 hypothetical protein DYL61_08745 [Pseudomonas nabeulensis]